MRFNEFETEKDLKVFEKLYKENKHRYYYIVFKMLQNESDAEDAVQTGFVKLASNFHKYRGLSYEELIKLTHTIIKNAAMDIIREKEKTAEFLEEQEPDNIYPVNETEILDDVIKEYEKEQLTKAIRELSEEEKELLYLQYQLEWRPVDIGQALGLSSNVVRKRILRIRQKLLEMLETDIA